jgi:hypothetical protein
MSVEWVLNANGSHEVSTKNHLLQIMHSGSLFANTGSPPSNYMSASYVQTATIDLESDSTNIQPIETFTGVYDGQEYSISNWSCSPVGGPFDFTYTALFGRVNNATIKNIVLDGVWTVSNAYYAAFLAGHSSGARFTNINTNFAAGTDGISSSYLAALFAIDENCTMQNITVGGVISRFEASAYVAGVTAQSTSSNWSYVKNEATFTTGMTTPFVYGGGVFGYCNKCTVTHVMNTMNGSVTAGTYTGGVFAYIRDASAHYICQSMKGNVVGATSGAIAGRIKGAVTMSHCVNYMVGDTRAGFAGVESGTSISKCVVAMNGATTYAAITSKTGSVEVLLLDSFGMTYNANQTLGTVSTMDTSTFDGISADGLPYFTFSFTDNASNTVDWPFVFANGAPERLALTSGPITINAEISAIPDNATLKLTYQGHTDVEKTAFEGFSSGPKNIESLEPETEYTVHLFMDVGDGLGYELTATKTTTTLADSAENYVIDDFIEEGKVRLDRLNATAKARISGVMNDLFTTGDKVSVSFAGTKNANATFVNRGGTARIEDTAVLLLPFDTGAGENQTVNIQLSDDSVTTVVYDEAVGTIAVGSDVYSAGDFFLMDGQKCCVYEYS